MGKQVDELIEMLQASLTETARLLSALRDDELDEHSDHPCAMGGTVRDLLTHNIDHERMHLGQLYSQRYYLKQMQKRETHRLIAETMRARMELIASLVGLPDDALDQRTPEEKWSVRDIVEHVVYWERHSVDDLARQRLADRVGADGQRFDDVRDPNYGRLGDARLAGAQTIPTP